MKMKVRNRVIIISVVIGVLILCAVPILINLSSKKVTRLGKLEEPETKQYSLNATVGTQSELSNFTYTASGTKVELNKYNGTSATSLTIHARYNIGGTEYYTVINNNNECFINDKTNNNLKEVFIEDNVVLFNSRNMFYQCGTLTKIIFGDVNTANVKDMSQMFGSCWKLEEINVSNFNTSNVTSMANMFTFSGSNSETGIVDLDLRKFNTSNVTNMYNMFGGAHIQSLDVTSFDTSNVTNMNCMFTQFETTGNLILSSFKIASNAEVDNFLNGAKIKCLATPRENNVHVTIELSGCTMYEKKESADAIEWTKWTQISNGNSDTSHILYREREFKVIFKSLGVEKSRTKVKEGQGATAPMLSRTGYTLSWDKSFNKVTDNLIVNAVWTANTYTVNLNKNGGTINTGNITSYAYGTGATLPTNVTKTGYTFGGWYENSSCTGTRVTSISNTTTGDKTYYAKWTINKYTVTFKDGSTTAKTQEVNHGSGATAPSLTKTGYTLSWDKSFNNVTSNITVNAVWTINKYTVTFKDGSTTAKTQEVNHGSGATAPSLTKTGYTLSWDKSFNNVTSNITVNAVWTANTYTVTLNKNEGTINSGDVTSYTYGIGAALPTNVTKQGYVFRGWYEDEACEGTAVTSIGVTETGAKVYYAKWLKDTDGDGTPDIEDTDTQVKYTVEHYVQNTDLETYTLQETENTLTGNLGHEVTANPKTYTGFSVVETDETIASGTVVDDGSLVLKLYYNRNNYTVTLNKNEGTINSGDVTSYTYGIGVALPTNVTKQGYVFRGWYEDEAYEGTAVTSIGVTETGEKVYYAKWLKDTDGDGTPDIEDTETLVNYTVEHYKQNVAQNGYEEPERETKQGNLGTVVNAISKTYAGFSENETSTDRVLSGTVVDDGSLTLKLYYDRNTYTVTLDPNGGTINDTNYMSEYTYGIGGNLPLNVTKEGYTFGGWYDNAELTGNAVSQVTASDLNNKTYYAKWNANGNTTYKVLHYKQAENGYTLAETQNLTGQTGANVTAVPKIYEGYVENTTVPERIPSGIILADGSLELKLYYDILTYQVTFKDGNTVLDTQTVSYGTSAVEPTPAPTKEGYVLRWDKEFNNVKSDLTVNAVWLRDTDGDGIPDIEDPDTLVEYVVRHYKQKGDTTTYELVEEEKLQGQLGSVVNAIPKAYVGYVENTTAPERKPSGTITSDEKLELILLYYRLKYKVTFKDGDEIVSEVEVLHGEEATPPNLTKPGYILSWDKALDNITKEQTINAVWTKIPEGQREYKVEHYVETKEGGYSLKETEKLVGDIGDVVLAVPKTYNEYILDETNKNTVKTGKIEENKELVLKLYYKYKRFTIIFKDGDKEVGREEVIYGETAKPPVLTKPGYILSWNKVLDDITKEQIITAVWTRDPNYKDPNAGKDDGKEEKPSILPKTGEEVVTFGAIIGLLGIAVVYFVKYKF